jgi:hypothetical protein
MPTGRSGHEHLEGKPIFHTDQASFWAGDRGFGGGLPLEGHHAGEEVLAPWRHPTVAKVPQTNVWRKAELASILEGVAVQPHVVTAWRSGPRKATSQRSAFPCHPADSRLPNAFKYSRPSSIRLGRARFKVFFMAIPFHDQDGLPMDGHLQLQENDI